MRKSGSIEVKIWEEVIKPVNWVNIEPFFFQFPILSTQFEVIEMPSNDQLVIRSRFPPLTPTWSEMSETKVHQDPAARRDKSRESSSTSAHRDNEDEGDKSAHTSAQKKKSENPKAASLQPLENVEDCGGTGPPSSPFRRLRSLTTILPINFS